MLPLPAGRKPSWVLARRMCTTVRRTLLYQIVDEYCPEFKGTWRRRGRPAGMWTCRSSGLPQMRVSRARLPAGACDTCHAEHLVAFSCKEARLLPGFAALGAWPRARRYW